MSIGQYIREIGRGKEGARSLSRVQAADLFGQVLDGTVTDLEVGGFCLAMRIKGETPEEMAGFLDATHARLQHVPAQQPVVVLPSYNGARKLPGRCRCWPCCWHARVCPCWCTARPPSRPGFTHQKC